MRQVDHQRSLGTVAGSGAYLVAGIRNLAGHSPARVRHTESVLHVERVGNSILVLGRCRENSITGNRLVYDRRTSCHSSHDQTCPEQVRSLERNGANLDRSICLLNLPLHGSDVFDHSKWSCTRPGMLTCINISQGEPVRTWANVEWEE